MKAVSDDLFLRRVLIVAGVGAAAALIWMLAPLLLLVFAGALLAITLRALAWPLRLAGLGNVSSLLVTVLIIVSAVALATAFYGSALIEQIGAANGSFVAGLEQWLARLGFSDWKDMFNGADIAATLPKFLWFGLSFGQAVLGSALVLAGGVYFAADPDRYRRGFLRAIPERFRIRFAETLDEIGESLHRWLGGMLTVMLIVGVLTGIGLWLAGVQSPLALGVLAGLANFIPFAGPIFTTLVVLVVAAAQDWNTILLAAGVMLAVQQIEGNVVSPMIIGNAVHIAPAAGLFAIAAMGMLFGPLGVLLGFPLTIVADVVLRRLWVEDVGHETGAVEAAVAD